MLKELATVAAYGASASFGRDIYKSTKNENPLLWLLISIAMTVYGFKLIVEGGQEGYGVARIFTLLGAVILIDFGVV